MSDEKSPRSTSKLFSPSFTTKRKSPPLITPKSALRKASTSSAIGLEMNGHTSHAVYVTSKLRQFSDSEISLEESLIRAANARKAVATHRERTSREGSISTASTSGTAGGLEYKIKALESKVDQLVPSIDRLSNVIETLVTRLDGLPCSRPTTQNGGSSTTLNSPNLTAAWRDHNNSFLHQQQLRRPSYFNSSRKQSGNSSLPPVLTPRTVAFTYPDLENFSSIPSAVNGAVNGTNDGNDAEILEAQEIQLSPSTQNSFRRRSRQMSKWDSDTGDDTADDADDVDVEEGPKTPVTRYNQSQRRPTGIIGAEDIPGLASINLTNSLGHDEGKDDDDDEENEEEEEKHKSENLDNRNDTYSTPNFLPKETPANSHLVDQLAISPTLPSENLSDNGLNFSWGWPSDKGRDAKSISNAARSDSNSSTETPDVTHKVRESTDTAVNSRISPLTPITPPKTPKTTVGITVASIASTSSSDLVQPSLILSNIAPINSVISHTSQKTPGFSIAASKLRPSWYFFAGRNVNDNPTHTFLQKILQHNKPPQLLNARVWNYSNQWYDDCGPVALASSHPNARGVSPTKQYASHSNAVAVAIAVPLASANLANRTNEYAHGVAFWCARGQDVLRLRQWWCGGEAEELTDDDNIEGRGFGEISVEIEFDEQLETDERGRQRVKSGEEEEEEEEKAIFKLKTVEGRMFVWKGQGEVLSNVSNSF